MKRAIFVRSKKTVMTELDKKIREKEIYKVTLVGSFVNFLLVIFKFLAGIAGHSTAMLADAVHSLSDFITDVVVILFVRISNKPVDKSHDYGHGKYETLATAFIGMALLGKRRLNSKVSGYQYAKNAICTAIRINAVSLHGYLRYKYINANVMATMPARSESIITG